MKSLVYFWITYVSSATSTKFPRIKYTPSVIVAAHPIFAATVSYVVAEATSELYTVVCVIPVLAERFSLLEK